MAQEADIITLFNNGSKQRSYTVANATNIPKGSLLMLSGDNTALISTAATAVGNGVPAGIASMEKEASDGSTRISCYLEGDFDLVASGAITLGAYVTSAGTNAVKQMTGAEASSSFALAWGRANETASDTERVSVSILIP